MFTDMKEALAAEGLELTPLGSGQSAAASLVVACHARDKDDLADLLGALGLPCSEDDLVTLLPHIPTTDTPKTGAPMPINAFTATAVSMLNNGDTAEHVREILGLSESELADAVQNAGRPAPDADTKDSAGTPQTPAVAPGADGIEALLAWAENHGAASIRNRAARVRSDLTELTARRAADAAQRAAEKRVAAAKAELEAAQAQLRKVKAGGRADTEDRASAPVAPALVPNGRRSSEELAAIRAWARASGHQVADRGTLAKKVLDAYDAAHRTSLAEAS
ncbi:Lsr2 family DNA-binding protein [Streptomyces flavofungini]|uniref:Lsr2 family DNA-binding protein n=1 Tax=Streptomyces flavofungini TaxID=68200 RepID=UPI0025AEFC92|nr:histone-like nucleoid-structuring protein Lsr2 [Streptomyces flavofungini]WJV51796.1 hypothetical protein QUY26_39925 [Streptomyces flavofungini]